MQSQNVTTIQEVVRKILTQSPHKHKLAAATLTSAWKEVMPAAVCRRTERIFAKDGKLFVQLSSAPLKHSLQANKDKVIQRLTSHSPDCGIKDLIFL